MAIEILHGDYRDVLNGVKADLIFTSPPYNIGSKSPAKTGKRSAKNGTYDPKSYRGIREYADNLPEDEYQDQQVDFLCWCEKHLNPGGMLIYNHKPRRKNGRMIHPMEWILQVPSLVLMEEIIWDRGSTHNHCRQMIWQHTERLYVFKPVASKYMLDNTRDLDYRSDVWRIGKAPVNGHNAPFPGGLARAVIKAWSPHGGLVCDPYAGSGTTAIAARDVGRHFVGAEILKNYYDKALERIS